MPRYSRDPKWITAKRAGKCSGCGRQIEAGERAFYYPSSRALYGSNYDTEGYTGHGCRCGHQASDDFEAAIADRENGTNVW